MHVNADDPGACIEAARTAFAYRQKFHKDFVINLIGYRRHGHNEGDEPRFTQPLMYQKVDKHPTARQLLASTLEAQGSLEAGRAEALLQRELQQLQDLKPDCILLDVEMPRMDGFEFARNVRADEATRRIPIIMITSRTADKHRNHALEIGVNEYMGKPYQEDQLLALIRRYTSESAFA
jgi:2-oxoglutarate dehydrogenase complex dehydrogenase (E1) component-like enzyme